MSWPRTDATDPSGAAAAPLRVALAWLVHPVTVLATTLLILNDQVLKAAYPGWLTGKLSDVAGLVMAPAVVAVALAAATRRLRPTWQAAAAVGVVGVVFAAVKANAAAAGMASAGWSVVNGPSVVLSDRSDLLALPALGLAWWTWRRVAARPMVLRRWAHLVAVLVVLPVALLGIAATSAPFYDDAVEIVEWRGSVMVGIGNAYHGDPREPVDWIATVDDGVTFSGRSDEEHREFLDARSGLAVAGTRDCSARTPRHCFRVVPGRLAVQESQDGGATWQIAWEVTEAQRARLAGSYPELGDMEKYLSSRALVVREQAGGGVVVLVANGRDGLARRDAAGQWARIGFGGSVSDHIGAADPPPESIAEPTPRTAVASGPVHVAGGLAVACVVAWIGYTALLARVRTMIAAWSGVLLLPGAVLMMGSAATREVSVPVFAFLGFVAGLGMAALAVAVAATVVRLGGFPLAAVLRVPVTGVVAGLMVLIPHLARITVGWPSQSGATVLALLAAGIALAASVPYAIWYARRQQLPETVMWGRHPLRPAR